MLRRRAAAVVSLIAVVPAGFASKFATPAGSWLHDHGAGALYEVFWILAAYFVWPQERHMARICWTVFVVTCGLEFLQLWHPPFLEAIRSTFVGATLIGTTFDGWDFPPYAIGSLLGWAWLKGISHKYGILSE